MQTQWLRTLVDPRQAQVLLDSYISTAAALPASARKQADLARLPLAFQDRVEQAENHGSLRSAWTNGSAAWLFIGQPVLEIEAYDYERRTQSRTTALRGPDGTWQQLKE